MIHVSVWQNPLQYCKVISLQLIKIDEKKSRQKKKKESGFEDLVLMIWKAEEECETNFHLYRDLFPLLI